MTWAAWAAWADQQRAGILAAGRWRAVRDFDASGPVGTLEHEGRRRPVVSFASNDYLGLTRHPGVVAAAHEALDRWGAGAGAARLTVGSRPVHSQLEAELAAWKGAERAVLFPTGYAANLGVLSALGGPGVRIVSDERNHASIVDGCRLSRADVVVYPHADVGAVDRAVRGAARAIVVTDGVFSMDGDAAPLDELLDVCRRRHALLVVDEAHAVLGPDLAGVNAGAGVGVLRVGTLSKALGSLGGFVAGPAGLADLVVNRARPFVFTTASSPADAAAALAALRVLRSSEGDGLKAALRRHVDRIAPGHPSPIVPVVVGDEEAAVAASASLLDRGLLVPAIRPPSVEPGTSRLRVTLSAAHTTEQVERLAAGLGAVVGRPSPPAAPDLRARTPLHGAVVHKSPRGGAPPKRSTAGPAHLVLVTGTGTEVGKTWVAARLLAGLAAGGGTVAARKPVQSFDGASGPTDAEVLAAATGERPGDVCPAHRRYELAMAPPMAAELLGRPAFTVADLVAELSWPEAVAHGVVEGVGGPRSPLASDGDTVALAEALRPDTTVLVADAGLGALNAVLLSVAALPGPAPVVVLNRYDAGDLVHAGNAEWLRCRAGLDVVTSVDELVRRVG